MTNTSSQMTLPNMLTLARLGLIPVFVVVFYLPFKWSDVFAAAIFLVAALTDLLDGYLARKLDQTSRFGAFLDPVADKLIVACALVMLVQVHASAWFAVPAMVIVCREVTVSALREWMAELGKRAKVAVSAVGKVKTVLQMVAITALLAQKPTFTSDGGLSLTPMLWLAYTLLYAATALTLWSMLAYLRAAWPELWKNSTSD